MTTFDEIYDVFLSQINDPVFMNLFSDVQEDLKKRYLLNAIPRFYCCKSDLTNRNESSNTFNIVLDDLEVLILGTQMHVEYLNPQISSLDNLKQSMTNNKDWTMTSQANHLKELRELRKELQLDVKGLMRDYTYNRKDVSK